MDTINAHGKRTYSKESILSSPRTLAKRRRTDACLNSIKCTVPKFTKSKLRASAEQSVLAANDELFLNPMHSPSNKHTQWVIACKFVIAANWKVPSCRIPSNMHFFVDHQKNLCALVENECCPITRDVLQHCNQIKTAIVRKYRRQKVLETLVTDSEESEDDDLSINTLNSSTKSPFTIEETVYIVRIPSFYYHQNITSSFYDLCCITARHLHETQHYGHPLFQILFKNIANFDSFQLSVPMVPLRGSLRAMFCQFGLGVYDESEARKQQMSRREFRHFIGLLDCWKERGRREECRKVLYQSKIADVNVMRIIVELTGLTAMDGQDVLKWTGGMQKGSTRYKRYKAKLRARIGNLDEIVDFQGR